MKIFEGQISLVDAYGNFISIGVASGERAPILGGTVVSLAQIRG